MLVESLPHEDNVSSEIIDPTPEIMHKSPEQSSSSKTHVPDVVNDKSHASNNTKTHSVIKTKMDGRCFFRSLAISDSTELLSCKRDMYGLPVNKLLSLREKTAADCFCASTMVHVLATFSN